MKGYNTIDELSLKESCEILHRNENNPHIEQVKAHYEQELAQWHANERSDFNACKSLRDYERFIAQYQKYSSFYSMQYQNAALNKIETLFWNDNNTSINKCNLYLDKYPHGKYTNEAHEIIKRLKRKRRIILTIILIILSVICIIAYKPAGHLSVSSESVTFSKYGETKNISITTKANDNCILASTTASWIDKNINGHSLQLRAEENPNPNRSATVTIKAYSTFFGNRISSISKTIYVHQDSGLPSYLKINKKNLNYDKYGNPKNSSLFIVKTDGIGCDISCSANYVHINKKITSPSHSPRVIEVEVSVDKNDSEYKNTSISISSGKFTEEVNLYQESGAATKFEIDRYRIRAAKEGAGEGYCYRVIVTTDGASWTANTSYSWISLNQYDNKLDITVTPNNDDVKTGYVYVKSNNGHSETITVEQDGNPTIFSLSKSSYTFDTDADYEYFSLTNNSDQPISCYTYSDSWLHPSIVNGELKVRCDNNNNSPRDGTVYVKCGNKETQITVYQKGWKDCSSCNGRGSYDVTNWEQTGTYYDYIFGWVPQYGWVTHHHECSKCKGKGKVKTN